MEWVVPGFGGEEFGEPMDSGLMNAFEGVDDMWNGAGGVHMESVWPGNGAGLWDSMLMPVSLSFLNGIYAYHLWFSLLVI